MDYITYRFKGAESRFGFSRDEQRRLEDYLRGRRDLKLLIEDTTRSPTAHARASYLCDTIGITFDGSRLHMTVCSAYRGDLDRLKEEFMRTLPFLRCYDPRNPTIILESGDLAALPLAEPVFEGEEKKTA